MNSQDFLFKKISNFSSVCKNIYWKEPNIRLVSDLRNYNEVLREIAIEEPVFLIKNGRGRYVIVDIKYYEKTQAMLKLLQELVKGEASAKNKG